MGDSSDPGAYEVYRLSAAGDFLYHPVFDRIGRRALHSFQLEFAHPITGEPMCFLAPVPEDFSRAFSTVKTAVRYARTGS